MPDFKLGDLIQQAREAVIKNRTAHRAYVEAVNAANLLKMEWEDARNDLVLREKAVQEEIYGDLYRPDPS